MKAKIGEYVTNAKNYGDTKELIQSKHLVAGMHDVMTIRAYMGKSSSASMVYVSLWIHAKGYHNSGKGSAGGYGYDKISAATADAMESANITLSEDIGGVGDSAVDKAMSAIAYSLGYRGKHLIIRD